MSLGQTRRPIIAAVRRNLARLAAGGWLSRGILLFLVLSTLLILTAPTRTIQLQARTLSAMVDLTGEPLAWDVTGAAVCTPTMDLDAAPEAPCGAGQVFDGRLDGPVSWARGQRLALDWSGGVLRIRLLNDGNGWPAGTVLRLSQADATRNGALALTGYLVLGQEMGSGSSGYVLEGRYAIFESGLVSSWLGWSPDISRQGDIRRGDQVQIVCEEGLFTACRGQEISGKPGLHRNAAAASISVDHDGNAGFHVIAMGEEADSLLEIAYAGRDETLLVKPNWVNRAAASSSLLALSLVFSLLAPLLLPMLDRVAGRR